MNEQNEKKIHLPFSVIMSVYHKEKPEYLNLSLESVCKQSFTPDEVYLVIDGPIGDKLRDVIDGYRKKYNFFTLYEIPENKGLANALRIAVENSKYELMFRMDSDDIAMPGRFEKQILAFEAEPADVIGGLTLTFSDDLTHSQMTGNKRKLNHEEIKKAMLIGSPFGHPTVLLRKSAVIKAGNYQDLFLHEDYYLWVRMAKAGCSFKNIDEYVLFYRFNEEQAGRRGGLKNFRSTLKIHNYLLENKMENPLEYIKGIGLKFLYQVCMTSKMRAYLTFKRRIIIPEHERNKYINDYKMWINSIDK